MNTKLDLRIAGLAEAIAEGRVRHILGTDNEWDEMKKSENYQYVLAQTKDAINNYLYIHSRDSIWNTRTGDEADA